MVRNLAGTLVVCILLSACSSGAENVEMETKPAVSEMYPVDETNQLLVDEIENREVAILAGGCFWCIETPFDKVEGVDEAISGYTGGDTPKPTYQDVAYGKTTHVEAVAVIFDPEVITYSEVLDIFWRQINPTDPGGQFADRGHHYTTSVYYRNDGQKTAAEASFKALRESGKFDQPIVTRLEAAGPFYVAEEYHQDYSQKNPDHYKRYHYGSGRGPYIEQTWGD